MIVVIHKDFDLHLEVCREEVVIQQDAVFEGLMPTFDLALGLRMVRFADKSQFQNANPMYSL